MTNLESISEKLRESNKEILENILKISGSYAITKNEFGVTVVEETNPASSLIFKNLSKPKYDEAELVKAIDVEVVELKPNIPTTNLDLVPRPLYDEQVALVEDLRLEVQKLTITISDLRTQITTLEARVQTEINNRLSIEQTNDALANQLDTMTNTINDFSNQISTSLQKSVDESILRASLQAQNSGYFAQIEALIKQIDSLNAIIDGLQSQLGVVQNQSTIIESIKDSALAMGAEVLNKVGLVSFNPKAEDGKPIIYLALNNKNGDNQFKYGSSISITNNDKEPISVELSAPKFLYVPKSKVTISPNQTEKIEFKIGVISYNKGSKSKNQEGTFGVKIIRNDGTSESKSYRARINIQHTKTYPSW